MHCAKRKKEVKNQGVQERWWREQTKKHSKRRGRSSGRTRVKWDEKRREDKLPGSPIARLRQHAKGQDDHT